MEVSVIIPVYNAVDYLDQAIRSAILQDEVSEVIVIDDGSTDGSFERLQEWDLKEEKVKLLTHPGRTRQRAAAARNLGIQAARGEYIAFLDADDYYLPDRFYWTKQTLEKHPNADAVFEAVQVVKDEGSPHCLPKDPILMLEEEPEHKIFEYILTSRRGQLSPVGLTIKREFIEKVGLMDESLPQMEDKDFILKLCLLGNIRRGMGGRMPVVVYRYHQTNTISNTIERNKSLYKLNQKWNEKLEYLPVSTWGKLIFLRNYMVGKYDAYDWPLIKKVVLYPFLYLKTVLANLNIL